MPQDEIGNAEVLAPREKIDILVPAHGHLDHSIKCIQSIYQNTLSPFHLIICDDSEASISDNDDNPVDGVDVSTQFFEKLAKAQKNVTYIKKDKPFISGNQFFNEAIKHMETPYLATVMNSMRVEPDWERVAVKLMKENPKIGVVGFKCIFPDTHKIECAGIEIAGGHMPTDIGRDLPAHYLTTIYEVEAIQWAFALVRKEAVEGNLDENLFYGFKGWDDIDNCFVLRAKGWKIFYCGYGQGIHHPRATRGTNSVNGYIKNKENAHKFWKRWGFWNNYLGSRTMDVADKINPEMKQNIKAVFTEFQMCKALLDARQSILKALTNQALKDQLKVSPDEYILGFDPSRDIWDLKRKAEPEVTNPVELGRPNEVAKAIPDSANDTKVEDGSWKARDEAVAKALKARNDAAAKVQSEYDKAINEAQTAYINNGMPKGN